MTDVIANTPSKMVPAVGASTGGGGAPDPDPSPDARASLAAGASPGADVSSALGGASSADASSGVGVSPADAASAVGASPGADVSPAVGAASPADTSFGVDGAPDGRAPSDAVRDPQAFRLTLDENGLAQVLFDVPGQSVNIFSSSVMEELEGLLNRLEKETAAIRVATFASGKPRSFIAGADIAEIRGIRDPDEGRRKVVRGQKIFQRLSELPFPTLAVIHGACLGGGLEFALACSHRIAAFDAVLALPEVKLGIIPAWGGTQRLPRLIGPEATIDLVCSGRKIDGRRALKLGLVDRLSPPRELRPRALDFARELAGTRKRSVVGRRGGLRKVALEDNPVGRKLLFHSARKDIIDRTGGHYPAPLRALQAIEEGLEGSLQAGLALEARLVSDLLVSARSKNLIHIHELFESVKKSPLATTPEAERPIERSGVVGAGVMGGGIAQLLASAGVAVRLKDVHSERVASGLRAARRGFDEGLRRKKLDRYAVRRQMNLISGTVGYEGFGRIDLVIEAVVEDLEIKRGVFAELESRVSDRTLLCTNTSSLVVADIARGLRHPERVAGLHFFNPVDRMPLVEVVRAPATSAETVAALYRLALRLRKKPVVVKDGPGFLVNRLLMPYLSEAMHLLGEGVDLQAIDGAMIDFGMPLGPLTLLDDIGLDVAYEAGRVMSAAFPDRMTSAPIVEALQASGRTGRKGGRGFYLYEGRIRKGPDRSLMRELGISVTRSRTSSAPGASELERRLVYPMINEAALCLADRVVGTAAELDLAIIAGTGFPPFRGGLLRHADAVGLETITAVLRRLAREVAPRFAPSAALEGTSARGGFYATWPG
jgi:3-hydroxyacyl-CoA dehydrogenase/enoyl-CoA hydratase/3-hydroxybutyryl-CoA epimerase